MVFQSPLEPHFSMILWEQKLDFLSPHGDYLSLCRAIHSPKVHKKSVHLIASV